MVSALPVLLLRLAATPALQRGRSAESELLRCDPRRPLQLFYLERSGRYVMIEVIGKRIPSLLGRAGKSTLSF